MLTVEIPGITMCGMSEFFDEEKSEEMAVADEKSPFGFEIPIGPITPGQQAFLINAYVVRGNIMKDLLVGTAKTFGEASFVVSNKNKRLEMKLKQLNHAKRYLWGQPYDGDSALSGLRLVEDLLSSRIVNVIDNPEDAAAAANEDPLIHDFYKKLNEEIYGSPNSMR
jgi:hypothetical protein